MELISFQYREWVRATLHTHAIFGSLKLTLKRHSKSRKLYTNFYYWIALLTSRICYNFMMAFMSYLALLLAMTRSLCVLCMQQDADHIARNASSQW